jgi:hypothetical protein
VLNHGLKQKHLDTLPKEVPGFTDQNVFIICQFCNGNGTRKTSVTIDELKKYINRLNSDS